MKIDVLARSWGSPSGGPNGMAIAAAFFAETLVALGHQVRRLSNLDGLGADLIITTISSTWRRTVAAAESAAAQSRLVYWHHASGVPEGQGCILAAPPSISPDPTWSRHVVLPPSSWAAEAGGACVGDEVLVAGAGPAKGGHVALAVAKLLPGLRWFVLNGRSSVADRMAWREIPGAEVAREVVEPERLLARARVVLAPTRFEVHPLLLVEAASRGIPIVCTDMRATHCASGGCAIFLEMNAPADEWAKALQHALEFKARPHRLPPYAEVAGKAIREMTAPMQVAA